MGVASGARSPGGVLGVRKMLGLQRRRTGSEDHRQSQRRAQDRRSPSAGGGGPAGLGASGGSEIGGAADARRRPHGLKDVTARRRPYRRLHLRLRLHRDESALDEDAVSTAMMDTATASASWTSLMGEVQHQQGRIARRVAPRRPETPGKPAKNPVDIDLHCRFGG
jgi:hypothetical protein